MTKPYDTRQVGYAYVKDITIVPNIPCADNQYRTRISINYELKDADKQFIAFSYIEHYSDLMDKQQSVDDIIKYVNDNLPVFIAADKADLSGYQPPKQ